MVIGRPSILTLKGELGLSFLPQVASFIDAYLLQKPARLIIDLSRVRYMDCSIVALLVTDMQCAASYGGKLMLAGASRNVRRMLERTRLNRCIPIYPTVSAALSES